MITERPYRKGLTLEDAKQELIRFSGTQFHPMVVNAFITVCTRKENLEMRQA